METLQMEILSQNQGVLSMALKGRMTSDNALKIEQDLSRLLSKHAFKQLILDFSDLDYLSSAGIRILMKLARKYSLRIEQAGQDVHDILKMTGMDTIIPVTGKRREIDLENLEKLGAGFHGAIYRLDEETMVKIINSGDLDEIEKERTLARKAFLLGIPTAISFDVIKAGDRYGIVYELLGGQSFQKEIEEHRDQIEESGKAFGKLAKEIHSLEIQEENFPDGKERLLHDLEKLKSRMKESDYQAIHTVLNALPQGKGFVHGDLAPGNVIWQNGKLVLIDMATVSFGHPILDLISLAVILQGSVYSHPEEDFVPFVNSLTKKENLALYDAFLQGYFDTENREFLERIKKQIFPFMLACKAMGMIQYLPEPEDSDQQVQSSTDTISSKVATLGLQGIVEEIEECLRDMKQAFKEIELPVKF